MKICCPLCQQTVPIGRFHSSADGIELSCAACEGGFFVSCSGAVVVPEAVGGRGDLPTEGEMRCPKCRELQPERDACRSCGLRAQHFEDYHSPETAEASAALRALWARVQETWDEEAAHGAFVEAAAREGQFAYAARSYRNAGQGRSSDRYARVGMDRLTRMAEAALLVHAETRSSASLPGKQPYRGVILLFAALLLLAFAGIAYMVLRGPNGAQQPADPALPSLRGQPGASPGFRRSPPPTGRRLAPGPAPVKQGP